MTTLRIDAFAGQFHANPWDRGTNEGEVEWPPSPWRMLRAITAGWYRNGAAGRDAFLRVLDALAEHPTYCLPRATAGYSRHYVPLGGLKNGKPEASKRFSNARASRRAISAAPNPGAAHRNLWTTRAITFGERITAVSKVVRPIGWSLWRPVTYTHGE